MADDLEGFGGDAFPPLIPTESPQRRATRTTQRLAQLEEQSNVHTTLLFALAGRDIKLAAGEILKWSVKKRGERVGDARHFYDLDPAVQQMVLLGCRAYGEFGPNPDPAAINAYKALSHAVITARNNKAHFNDVEELDAVVDTCLHVINAWPGLEVKYPAQAKIIRRYNAYKTALPECFR